MKPRLFSTWAAALALVASAASAAAAADAPITPAQYLAAQAPPKFRANHTLPPLTRFGWTLSYDARVELASRWGYALEFGGYAKLKQVETKLADPNSIESRLCALAAAQPDRIKLAVILDRDFPKPIPDEFWVRDEKGNFTDGRNTWQDPAQTKFGKIASPEGPDDYWRKVGEAWAAPLKLIRERAPIAVVLNGGEYAMGVTGAQAKQWDLDPRVRAARGSRSWFEYASHRKAHQEAIVAKAVREALPDRELYIYYNTSSESHRMRYAGWEQWAYDSAAMRNVSDLPSFESYYRHFNSGWTGKEDALTMALNSVGYHIALGAPFSYNWLCAGWERKSPEDFADIDRYMGFVKCCYTAGMLGGNAGYYAYPKGGFDVPFPPDQPPHWLRQMIALARVHGFFSHREPFLRQSHLLPGPAMHKWSKDQPAYEFPTGDADARVLVRKARYGDQWLITAWAAGGAERPVTVEIPRLGSVTVQATPAASVYDAHLADGKPVLALIVEE